MKMLHQKLNGPPSGEGDGMKTPTVSPGKAVLQTAMTMHSMHNIEEADEEENEWNDDFAASPTAFDAIMTDAESKKRMAAESSLVKAKKSKPQLAPITRSTAQGRNR